MITIIRVINKDSEVSPQKEISSEKLMTNGEKRIGFKNIELLYKEYRGEIPKNEIAARIEKIALQYIPILKNKAIDEEISIEDYYKENSAVIRNRFGITDIEKFKRLVDKIKTITCDINDCKSYEIQENSFTKEDMYTKCTVVYTYSNNQEIKLDFYINNSNSDSEIEYKIDP